jgi:serine/threonine protein phosphatase PrpC
MTSEQKLALKSIPFSLKSKINKTKLNLTKNPYTYTTIAKPNNKLNINSGKKEWNEKIKDDSLKGIKLINYKNFKKSISSKYDNKNNQNNQNVDKDNSINSINSIPKTKSNTIHIFGSKLITKDNQNKIINISYNGRFDPITISNENSSKKSALIISRLKKGKNEKINKELPIKRLKSQQSLTSSKLMKDEIPKSINITRNIDNSQKYQGDNISDIKNNYSHKKNPNTSTINKAIFTKINNSSEIKKDLTKNYSYIQKITIAKINPQENNKVSSISINSNKKNNNLSKVFQTTDQKLKNKKHLYYCSKHESRPRSHISNNNKVDNVDNSDEDWDDNEYMGLRKRTFDPGKGARKNKSRTQINNLIKNNFLTSELFSQKTFIKSCESITVAGKRENGHKKINQDSYIIERNINGILNFNLFGVLDGHGVDGHYASQFVTRYIINRIKNHPLLKKCEQAKEIYQKIIFNGYQIIANIFTDADIEIQKEKFNCKNSGTTCVIVLQLEDKIICANTGDSRAIIIYDDNSYDNNLSNSKICPLSYDCKPELPNERKRIYEYGGTVERALDENDVEGGPYRVWAFGENYPGLAMSRSIGDMDAKKIGVIPNPQIVEYSINKNSKYMLICSDGVWEFISNEEAMKIGNNYYLKNDAMGLCQELYKKSVYFWTKEDDCIDDITAIAVFF